MEGPIGWTRGSEVDSLLPDINFISELQIATGDAVASVRRVRGTHRGGLMGIAPTGRQIEVLGISVLRLTNGKISHQTTTWDALGPMQQLGAIPAPGQATA